MNNDIMNILGILILPFALMIIAIIYIAAQVKFFVRGINESISSL